MQMSSLPMSGSRSSARPIPPALSGSIDVLVTFAEIQGYGIQMADANTTTSYTASAH